MFQALLHRYRERGGSITILPLPAEAFRELDRPIGGHKQVILVAIDPTSKNTFRTTFLSRKSSFFAFAVVQKARFQWLHERSVGQ